VTSLLLTSLVVLLLLGVVLWLVSLPLANASIVDIVWGPAFALVAWTAHGVSTASSPRAWLVSGLVTIWGVRLAVHLAARNLGHGEDYRYRAMREAHGDRFPIVSLGTVFLLQAGLIWVVSLPIQAVHAPAVSSPLGWIDAVGVGLWAVGFAYESIADVQLTRFKRTAASGQILDRGLWRHSRHPNYFGDFLVWWGFGVIALAAGAWWALIGPIVMTVLLLKVSGVALLESTIADRRPAYRDYITRTSAFVPWPRKVER
jgi:steroid 5-alpha reductase family enzyme